MVLEVPVPHDWGPRELSSFYHLLRLASSSGLGVGWPSGPSECQQDCETEATACWGTASWGPLTESSSPTSHQFRVGSGWAFQQIPAVGTNPFAYRANAIAWWRPLVCKLSLRYAARQSEEFPSTCHRGTEGVKATMGTSHKAPSVTAIPCNTRSDRNSGSGADSTFDPLVIMGGCLLPIRSDLRHTSSWHSTQLWHLPCSTRAKHYLGWGLGGMGIPQQPHHKILEARVAWRDLAGAEPEGCRPGILHSTFDLSGVAEDHQGQSIPPHSEVHHRAIQWQEAHHRQRRHWRPECPVFRLQQVGAVQSFATGTTHRNGCSIHDLGGMASAIISRVEERIGPMPTGAHQFQRLNPFAAWFASGTQPGVHQHSKSTTPSSLDCRLQLRLSIATPDWLRLWGGDCSGAWPVSTLMTPTSLTGVPQKGMDSTVSNSSMPCWGPHGAEKRQAMSPEGLFLGLHHNLQHVRQGFVTFWPRERLIEKMQTFVLDALASSQLTSGTASKIYGMMNFLEQGIYGRIGCSGLCAIKERQQEISRKMTPALQESLTLILEVLKLRPLREMEVIHRPVGRFVAASDAALEAPFEGSGGFLIVWFNGDTQQRHAFVSDIPRSVYDIFTPGEKKIAQLELIQIIYALVHCSSQFRGRRGIWYLDNTAALMVLIRGRSDSADLERMAQIIHCLMFGLRCWFFFEWIESKSNWADAISRLGFQGPWYQGQGFSAAKAFFPSELWRLRLADLIRVAEFL